MANKTINVTVKYTDIYLHLEGHYTASEPRTYDYPGAPSEFDIEKVYIEDTDIFDLLSIEQIDEIEQLALESLEDR